MRPFHPLLLKCTALARSELSIRDIVLNSSKVTTAPDNSKVDNVKVKLTNTAPESSKHPITCKKSRPKALGPPEWVAFNQSYNKEYDPPSTRMLQKANEFFNKSKVTFEWGVPSYSSIPDEVVKSKFKDMELERAPDSTKRFPGKTSIPFHLINGLPEITFLGRSNAGKSTILNSLVSRLGDKHLNKEARMSSKPGFTKTLNCFNIGNKFRLIDTPGYGYGSRLKQGGLTMEYIENREQLVRCYVLVSADQGFTEMDLQILNYLKDIGKPFEVVLTKMDKVRDMNKLTQQIEESGITTFPTLPRLIFTSSVVSSRCPKRYGIAELRCNVLQNCGLDSKW